MQTALCNAVSNLDSQVNFISFKYCNIKSVLWLLWHIVLRRWITYYRLMFIFIMIWNEHRRFCCYRCSNKTVYALRRYFSFYKDDKKMKTLSTEIKFFFCLFYMGKDRLKSSSNLNLIISQLSTLSKYKNSFKKPQNCRHTKEIQYITYVKY